MAGVYNPTGEVPSNRDFAVLGLDSLLKKSIDDKLGEIVTAMAANAFQHITAGVTVGMSSAEIKNPDSVDLPNGRVSFTLQRKGDPNPEYDKRLLNQLDLTGYRRVMLDDKVQLRFTIDLPKINRLQVSFDILAATGTVDRKSLKVSYDGYLSTLFYHDVLLALDNVIALNPLATLAVQHITDVGA